ncbi:MAG: DUF5063 domain-containing protein [Prolixibacteraceae bacterium]|jgi:hypothetical protein|nr:DUF5063 domain-containing protein [Prolixibacteraceae bacterium]
MSENDFEHIAYSKDVIEFVTVANEYCAFIENHASIKRGEFVEKVQKIYPLLYLKASMLPDVEDENVETPAKYVTEVDYSFLMQKISEKLARFDSYQEVFDADMQFSEGAVEASIAEDICDIYQDLKDFLMAYRVGTTEIMTDAIWECQKNFSEYWGQRLVNSLRAIHHVVYSDDDINEDEPEVFSSPGDEVTPHKEDGWVNKHFNNYSDDEK